MFWSFDVAFCPNCSKLLKTAQIVPSVIAAWLLAEFLFLRLKNDKEYNLFRTSLFAEVNNFKGAYCETEAADDVIANLHRQLVLIWIWWLTAQVKFLIKNKN